MTFIALAIYIFLELLVYVIIFDIILSWLSLVGIRFRPKFLYDIISPIYKSVRKYIPTTFGMFDFTPIIILITISFVKGLLVMNVPGLSEAISQIIK